MTIAIDWAAQVISIQQVDLAFISGTLYALDTDAFRLTLKGLEDDIDGMPFPDTHRHNTEVTIAGATYARFVEIINGYTVVFEDGQYAVRLDGSNNNIFDEGVIVRNQVSIIPTNSAGLISGVSIANDAALLRKVFLNRAVTTVNAGPTPPAGTKTVDFYDDDQATVIDSIQISADGNTRTNP